MSKEVSVRSFKAERDLLQVEALEQRCEAGIAGSSSISLFADLLGDPLCRVRHLPAFSMLVAEVEGEIVGVIRGGVKDVVYRQSSSVNGKSSKQLPSYARVGYLLGLRVCPSRRRMGVGSRLVERMEQWCKDENAEFVYMATEEDNVASVKLFTKRLKYMIFRTPVLLVHPVFMHSRSIPAGIQLTKLSVDRSISLYRATMGTREFFPKDIDLVLGNKLCAGTWVATFGDEQYNALSSLGSEERGSMTMQGGWAHGASWAMLSVWKSNELFKLQVAGVSLACQAWAALSRWVDWALPWCRVSSIPNIFTSFGMQFMFGLHCEGERGPELLTALCWHAHNVARKHGCQAIMAEVSPSDPALACIPHWKKLSGTGDRWCIKCIATKNAVSLPSLDLQTSPEPFDWCKSPQTAPIFVDPREV